MGFHKNLFSWILCDASAANFIFIAAIYPSFYFSIIIDNSNRHTAVEYDNGVHDISGWKNSTMNFLEEENIRVSAILFSSPLFLYFALSLFFLPGRVCSRVFNSVVKYQQAVVRPVAFQFRVGRISAFHNVFARCARSLRPCEPKRPSISEIRAFYFTATWRSTVSYGRRS